MSTTVPIKADINSQSFEQVKTYLVEIGRRAGMTEKDIDDMFRTADEGAKKTKKSTEEVGKGFGGLTGQVGNLAKGMASAFSVALVAGFARKVIDVTAQFQKMEAVLKTALGSQSAAQVSMRMLKDFASNTPFQVDKLTESYVKLVNQGFKPTRQELTKLGDFAASMGKEFDQLTEAIIDAQVGEFERLKEFGVRAQKEGDRVKFTFKGVTTEVQNTEAAIRGYILSLGDAEGVSGSMAAVAETVFGKLSNLDDNFTNLFATIGDSSSGLIAGLLDLANNGLGALTTRLDAINQVTDNQSGIMSFFTMLRAFADPAYAAQIEGVSKAMQSIAEAEQTRADASQRIIDEENKKKQQAEDAAERARKQAADAARAAAEKAAQEKARIDALGVIGKLEYEITQLQKERAYVSGPAELARINAQIQKRKEEVTLIERMAEDIVAPSLGNPFDAGLAALSSNMDGVKEQAIAQLEQFVQRYKEANKEAKKSDTDWASHREELIAAGIDTAMMAADGLARIAISNAERQIQAYEMERDQRLALAGEDADQRALIEEQYAKKIAEQRRKQAQADKIASLFQIAVNTAVGITATIKQLGLPLAIPFVALAAAQGAIQAGVVASQPLPKFKDGVVDLKGPGTDTSDSIHAMLSRGESVIPARKTRAFRDLIKPIVEDDNITYEKLMGIILDKVPLKMRGDLMGGGRRQAEDGRSLEKLDLIYQAIKNQKATEVIVDQAGATVRNKRHGRVVKTTYDFLHG